MRAALVATQPANIVWTNEKPAPDACCTPADLGSTYKARFILSQVFHRAQLDRVDWRCALVRRDSPEQKLKAMDPEIARNQNYDDHYADDSKDIHPALLPLHDMTLARLYSATIKSIALFRHRWLDSTEAKQVQVIVIATVYIPNSRPLRRAEIA